MDETPAAAEQVDAVRRFNRFYTNAIGVVGEGVLGTTYSLTEARLIFELAQHDSTEVVDLRRTLGIDAGYLSRLLARFESDGLVARSRSDSDRRRQVVELTGQGKTAATLLDSRSSHEIGELLVPIDREHRRRLVVAMEAIQRILESGAPVDTAVLRPPVAGDFGWVVHRHGVVYADEYGWDDRFEALVARIVAEFAREHDARRERMWIAEVRGEPVGCIFCVKKEETVAQLRLLLVEPTVRGSGIGTRLIDACVRFARRAGYERLVLWTNDVLVDARRLYERAGFELIDQEAHRNFGRQLVGQTWSLEL